MGGLREVGQGELAMRETPLPTRSCQGRSGAVLAGRLDHPATILLLDEGRVIAHAGRDEHLEAGSQVFGELRRRRDAVRDRGFPQEQAVVTAREPVDHLVMWQCFKGNPGIGDVETYEASQLAPGVNVVSWSEKAETLAVVAIYNYVTRTVTGHLWGYDPDIQEFMHAPLGGKILDPAEYGVKRKLPADAENLQQQKNKDVVLRQHEEEWNQSRYDEVIDQLFDDEFSCHFFCDQEGKGKQYRRDFIKAHLTAFPDWKEEVVQMFSEGDLVVSHYRSTGTHTGGPFAGIEPTGRKVEINEYSLYRLSNGKIIEQWGMPDRPC